MNINYNLYLKLTRNTRIEKFIDQWNSKYQSFTRSSQRDNFCITLTDNKWFECISLHWFRTCISQSFQISQQNLKCIFLFYDIYSEMRLLDGHLVRNRHGEVQRRRPSGDVQHFWKFLKKQF